MDITKLSSLLTLKDDGSEVTVYLGWVPVASITEDDGYWYPSVISTCEHSSMKEIGSLYDTKEAAFACIVKWFSP
jgi:hypothetical protein